MSTAARARSKRGAPEDMSRESAARHEVEQRVAEVLGRIADAARRSGRSPAEITLVGASKRQPLERIVAAVRSGVLSSSTTFPLVLRPRMTCGS